jgi:transcription elongation factor GreA
MEKIPMTRAGFVALDEELKHLKSVERPAIIRAIAEAREHGDLSENAEYHSAREKQSFIEGRIKELEGLLSLAEVIDPTRLSGAIKFGATVTIVDEDSDEEKTYQIVGETEADIEAGKLNIRSPLARALISKDEGDSVEVKTPGGNRRRARESDVAGSNNGVGSSALAAMSVSTRAGKARGLGSAPAWGRTTVRASVPPKTSSPPGRTVPERRT